MKKRMIGLALLVVIMLVTGGIYMAAGRTPQIITVDGYVGGEKIELLEDEEVQSILEEDSPPGSRRREPLAETP